MKPARFTFDPDERWVFWLGAENMPYKQIDRVLVVDDKKVQEQNALLDCLSRWPGNMKGSEQ